MYIHSTLLLIQNLLYPAVMSFSQLQYLYDKLQMLEVCKSYSHIYTRVQELTTR